MEIKPNISTGQLTGTLSIWKLIAAFVFVNIMLIGTVALFAALDWKPVYLKFVGVSADGVIMDFKSSGGMEPGFAPVVEFNVEGQTYSVVGTYTDPQTSVVGDHIEVIYDPGNPNTALVNDFPGRLDTLMMVGGAVIPAFLLTDLILIFLIVIRIFVGRMNKSPA